MICDMGRALTVLNVQDIDIFMTVSGSKVSARVLVKKSQRTGNTMEIGSTIKGMARELV